jgi:indole-3-glycerol phosphate synthase
MATKELVPQIDVIIAAKRQYLQERKSQTPIEAIRALASMQKRPQPVLSAVTADTPVMLVGNIKYAMPQTGPLMSTYDPVGLALRYTRAGMDAVTLFTDESLYQGGLDDMVLVSRAVNVPLISQDYILDEYQVVEARAAGASALVLCSTIVTPSDLRVLVSATQRNRMTAIVEVRNQQEIEYALSLSPYVIGLSGRDLHSRDVTTSHLPELRALIPSSIRVMLMDPLRTLDEVHMAVSMGVHAIVIDEALLDSEGNRDDLDKILRRSTPQTQDAPFSQDT